MVEDRRSKQAFERGLTIYPMGGTVDGKSGDHMLPAPLFICDIETIDLTAERLAASIHAVVAR